jgi:hypothetical protein
MKPDSTKSILSSADDSIINLLNTHERLINSLVKGVHDSKQHEKFLDIFSYDTVFTVVVTLTIFILGVIADRALKYSDQQRERRGLRLFIKTNLDKIIGKSSTNISKVYKDFYQSTTIDTGLPPFPPKVLTGDFERLNKISVNKIFESIDQKDSLSVILSHLDFIEKLPSEVHKYHLHCHSESESIRKPLQVSVNEYINLLAIFVEHIKKDNPEYEYRQQFFELINNSISKYYNEISNTRQLKRFYKTILRPIQDMGVVTNIFRKDKDAFEIIKKGKEISHQYNAARHLTIECRLEYRKFHQMMEESILKLKEQREKITWR